MSGARQFHGAGKGEGVRRFKPGGFVPSWPARELVDGGVTLPESVPASFWLDGSVWQLPDYENADTFVAWLVRAGLLVIDLPSPRRCGMS